MPHGLPNHSITRRAPIALCHWLFLGLLFAAFFLSSCEQEFKTNTEQTPPPDSYEREEEAKGEQTLNPAAPDDSEEPDQNHTPTTSSKPVRLLLLGDSLTSGWISVSVSQAYPAIAERALRQEGYNIIMTNISIPGSETAAGLITLSAKMALSQGSRYTHILIALGSNDGLNARTVNFIEKNLNDLVEVSKSYGMAPLLAGQRMPPSRGKYSEDFRKIFPRVAHKHDIPLWDFLLRDVGGEPSKNEPDGIHPNHKGHRIIAKHFMEFLKKQVLDPLP